MLPPPPQEQEQEQQKPKTTTTTAAAANNNNTISIYLRANFTAQRPITELAGVRGRNENKIIKTN
jgi:hypothetical protein